MKLFRKKNIVYDGAIIIALIVLMGLGIVHYKKIETINTLEKINSFPFYVMYYKNDYGFNQFLEKGAASDKEIEKFVIKKLLLTEDFSLKTQDYACTAFSADNKEGQRLTGRNFDFDYTPALLLFTDPEDGYASVSMVNLSYAGYSKGHLPDSLSSKFRLLAAPYLPFDGLNEQGVAMALLAVPRAKPGYSPDKPTLNTTTAIRLVLDYAANVNEAISLLEKYNYYFSGNIECHYLISDKTGNSVVVEFVDGKLNVIPRKKNYQVVTNFIMTPEYYGEGEGHQRFKVASERLRSTSGQITASEAMQILNEVQIPDRTLWSMVYNNNTGDVKVAIGRDYKNIYEFQLSTVNK